jgi:hypothetical protein
VACPVCKGEMTKDMLIPLYGFGANTARGGGEARGRRRAAAGIGGGTGDVAGFEEQRRIEHGTGESVAAIAISARHRNPGDRVLTGHLRREDSSRRRATRRRLRFNSCCTTQSAQHRRARQVIQNYHSFSS